MCRRRGLLLRGGRRLLSSRRRGLGEDHSSRNNLIDERKALVQISLPLLAISLLARSAPTHLLHLAVPAVEVLHHIEPLRHRPDRREPEGIELRRVVLKVDKY